MRFRDQLVLSCYWFSLNFQISALAPIVLPLQVALFVAPGVTGNPIQAAVVGGLAASGAVLAVIMQPLAGMWSDRTASRLGRRGPYILIGSILMLASALIMAGANGIGLLVIGFLIYSAANDLALAAYQALIPDRVPPFQRGAASGYMGLMNILGNVIGLGLAGYLLSNISNVSHQSGLVHQGVAIYYAITGLLMVVGMLITLVGVRENSRGLKPPASHSERRGRQFWLDPWRDRNFSLVFATGSAFTFGITLFTTYIAYYFATVHLGNNFAQETVLLSVFALLSAVASAVFMGILSDRLSRAPMVAIALVLMGVATMAFVFDVAVPLWALGICFGFGFGTYTSVNWALAIDTIQKLEEAAKTLGLWNLAANAPAIIAPLIGSGIVAIGSAAGDISLGYRAVFGVASASLLLGAVLVLQVRLPKATVAVEG